MRPVGRFGGPFACADCGEVGKNLATAGGEAAKVAKKSPYRDDLALTPALASA